jgi:ABC-type glycerol-3-phosphate transport system substrate-binding protein
LAARVLVALAATLGWAGLAAPASGQGSPASTQLGGETNGISIIQLTGTYDTELGGQSNIQPRQAVAQEFYRTHPDQFDFLVVFPNFSFSSSDGIRSGTILCAGEAAMNRLTRYQAENLLTPTAAKEQHYGLRRPHHEREVL